LPKSMPQPTSSQYVFALAKLGTAAPDVEPLTGKPVSVTQTSLPWAAATVASNALWNNWALFSMLLGIVFWK